jgi:hypothetical protein
VKKTWPVVLKGEFISIYYSRSNGASSTDGSAVSRKKIEKKSLNMSK